MPAHFCMTSPCPQCTGRGAAPTPVVVFAPPADPVGTPTPEPARETKD